MKHKASAGSLGFFRPCSLFLALVFLASTGDIDLAR